jgi:uncharacterized lipoprotein YddW (UPF0748 family)
MVIPNYAKKAGKAFYMISFMVFFLFAVISGQDISPRYEFRGAWIATVDNIDWPSRKGLPVDSQKAEYIRILELHKLNGMNAVIMQIRPAADAFYPSSFEPWSEWLTGVQGKPPFPYYDPLQFMIDETHKRGMEFHAWCNPYRAMFNINKSSVAPTHITRMHPEWFLDYGDKRYFDPGNKEAQVFVTQIVGDIVKRYDVDAIHFDDYFYPYRISGKIFPDSASYKKYNNGLSLEDWRRSNVDSIIVQLYREIRKENPNCRFGISPFGVWRNQDKDVRGSATKAGQTNYDDLYADILLWLEKGWIDYVVPQLYWEFGHPAAPFDTLLEWWSNHTYGKACYIGLGYYKAGSNKTWKDVTLIPRQLKAMRNTPNIHGAVYFSSKSFFKNPLGWNDSLQNNFYRYPALVPPVSGIKGETPPQPLIINQTVLDDRRLNFSVIPPPGTRQPIRQVALYARYAKNGDFSTATLFETKPFTDTVKFSIQLPPLEDHVQYFLTYVNPENQESVPEKKQPVSLQLVKRKNGGWSLD